MPRYIIIKIIKAEDKEKYLECSQRKTTHYLQENNEAKPNRTKRRNKSTTIVREFNTHLSVQGNKQTKSARIWMN